MTMADTAPMQAPAPRRVLVWRHSLWVRLTHWLNVFCLTLLLGTGLQIFNAHPNLYWGAYGFMPDQAWLSLSAVRDPADPTVIHGMTRIGNLSFDTTGILGASENMRGDLAARGFPSWLTLPGFQDLGSGRRWHFFFAWLFVINGLIYLIYGLLAGHFRRDLVPAANELTPGHIGHEIANHARLRFPKGEEARHYNTLQKLTYLAVIAVLLPGMLITGLTMSPGFNAFAPWMLDVLGGRQSARSLHFICAALIVAFVVVHIVMVVLSGVWNNMRSMITGRYAIRPEAGA